MFFTSALTEPCDTRSRLDGSLRNQMRCQPSGAFRALKVWGEANFQLVTNEQDEKGSEDRKDEARGVKCGAFSRPGKHVRHSAADYRTDDAEHDRPN